MVSSPQLDSVAHCFNILKCDITILLFQQLMVGTQSGNHGGTAPSHVVILVSSIETEDAQIPLLNLMDWNA